MSPKGKQPSPATPRNPRGPLLIDTRELGRRPGSMRRVERQVPAPAGFGLDLIAVPESATLDLVLRLEAVAEGVLASGTVTAPVEGECGRCLTPISDSVVVDLQELFAYPDSTTVETTEDDEVSRLEDEQCDLEPVVRDAVVLALPLTPLCRDDCPGLCPVCGQHWDTLPADHTHEVLDPRWAALAAQLGDSDPDPAGEPDRPD